MSNESYHLGLEKARQQDYAGAIAAFSQTLQENPYFAEAYCQRGLMYYDSGETLQAVADFSEALKLSPQMVEAYYSRALARVVLKNLPGALEDINQAIRFNEQYAPAYSLRGTIYRKQGDLREAIANFKKAADLYLRQQDKEGCRRCLEKIKQIQPSNPTPLTVSPLPSPVMVTEQDYFKQLLDQAEQGNCQAALTELNWALKADPQDGKAYCCRGVVRCKMQDYRGAIADFNQALKLSYSDPLVYRNRGKARFQLGDHQGAIADFDQVLKLQPEDPLLYLARGDVYRAIGNYLGAIEDYSQVIRIEPDNAKAYYNRGAAYACLEEIKQAIVDYQKAASLFCEQEDWESYNQTLANLKKLQNSVPKSDNSITILRQRLLRLVGGQWAIAERLLDQAKFDSPGMTEEWYLEKVIYDLERDRGR